MFKKTEIKKALGTICKSKTISKAILKAKTDAEQSGAAFVKNFASNLYSDELMEFLNDNSIDKLLAIQFTTYVNLGELSNCASAVYQEQFLNNKEYRGRREKVCLVGEREKVSNLYSYSDDDYDCPPDKEVEGDTKKAFMKFIKRLVFAIIFFFLPTILNFFLGLIDPSYSTCVDLPK